LKPPTAILILTHDPVGTALLRATEEAVGPLPLPFESIGLRQTDCADAVAATAQAAVKRLRERADQLLILTDIFGATPSNICHRLESIDVIVHGINLPMLLRLANYPDLAAIELAERIIKGGKRGIFSGSTPL